MRWVTLVGLLAVLGCEPVPPTQADPAPLHEDPTFIAVIQGPTLTSHAEREKGAPGTLGVCDYDGPTLPCWCFSPGVGSLAGLNTYGDCDSPVQYMRDVQTFGAPRGGAVVGFRQQALDVTIEGE
jgi:hypothetical protein